MKHALYFKALQRKLKYRNPDAILHADQMQSFVFTQFELDDANVYIKHLESINIQYTYPGHVNYPQQFYKMIEPPLFIEYIGQPCWLNFQTLSVVGARKIDKLTIQWMDMHLKEFLQIKGDVAIVSGGAEGVDILSHVISLKINRPTLVVLPCGLHEIYPQRLKLLKDQIIQSGGCLLTEFELNQTVRKNYFYFRNRIIAGFSALTLVVQAERKSGSFLTVHHALQNGKTVLTVPSHPMMSSFSGNQYLMKEGAFFVSASQDLLDFWEAESWSGPV